jgi:hypothetical protein
VWIGIVIFLKKLVWKCCEGLNEFASGLALIIFSTEALRSQSLNEKMQRDKRDFSDSTLDTTSGNCCSCSGNNHGDDPQERENTRASSGVRNICDIRKRQRRESFEKKEMTRWNTSNPIQSPTNTARRAFGAPRNGGPSAINAWMCLSIKPMEKR